MLNIKKELMNKINCKYCAINKNKINTKNHKPNCKCYFCCYIVNLQNNKSLPICKLHSNNSIFVANNNTFDLDLDFTINSNIESDTELYGDTYINSCSDEFDLPYESNYKILLESSQGLYGDSKYVCNLENNNSLRFYSENINIDLIKSGQDVSIGLNLDNISIKNSDKNLIYDNNTSSLLIGQHKHQNVGNNSISVGHDVYAKNIGSCSIGINHSGILESVGVGSITIGSNKYGKMSAIGTGSLCIGENINGNMISHGSGSVSIGSCKNGNIITRGTGSASIGIQNIQTDGISSMSVGRNLINDVNYGLLIGCNGNISGKSSGIYVAGGAEDSKDGISLSLNTEIYGDSPIGSMSCDYILLSGSGYIEYFEKSEEIEIGIFVGMHNNKLIKNNKTIGVTCIKSGIMCNSSPLHWCESNKINELGELVISNNHDQVYKNILLKYNIDINTTVDSNVLKLHPMKDKIFDEIKNSMPDKNTINSSKYDGDKQYIGRQNRDSWIPVCLLGQVRVRDNGMCEPNSYCDCKNNIAVPGTNWFVIKRISKNVIMILYK